MKTSFARNEIVRAGVAVVITQNGRLLAGKRSGIRGAGQWSFPGGSIDHGEGLMEAAERETDEETGLIVKAMPYSQVQPELFVVNHIGPDHFLVAFIEARVVGGELVNKEPDRCEGWDWLTLDELTRRLPPEAIDAWKAGKHHECLCWIPFAQLMYLRGHLGL